MSAPAETVSLIRDELAALVASLSPEAGAAVYDAAARRVWTAGAWRDEDAAAMALYLRRGRPAKPFRIAGARRVVHGAPVSDESSAREPATLAVACDGAASGSVRAAARALASILALITRLNRELDGMADELADRYEELNLVYAASNEGGRLSSGRAALQSLVNHCREHLGVSLVALLLPRQGLVVESHDERKPIERRAELLAAAGEFCSVVTSRGRTVVCNESMSGAEPLQPFGPMKLVATPVGDGRAATCGLLLVAKPYADPDFSNSDKNLLASIGERAVELIERSYDSLTGLPLRHELERRLAALHAGAGSSGDEHSVLVIDIDELRVVSETLGPKGRNAVIRFVASQLEQYASETAMLARLEADNFAVLLEGSSVGAARALAEDICATIRRLQFSYCGQPVALTVSIGVASVDPEVEDPNAVLQAAEVTSAAAHDHGRDRVSVYQDGAASLVLRNEQMRWAGRIHEALRNERFSLHGQLIQPLAGQGDDVHVEVLLRLVDDDGVMQPPGVFLPAAERYFLMPAIDRWVVDRAFALLARSRMPRLPVLSINLSGQSMSDESFMAFIARELDEIGDAANRVCFEITETAAIKSMDGAKQFILRLKERGCRFSLDDFGTGLSSFSYLKALPVDFVKIDGSFVKGIIDDRVSESMVRAITDVGHAMGLKIIAEYVENDAIIAKLKSIGVDFAQGYAVERPIPLVEHLGKRRRERRAANS